MHPYALNRSPHLPNLTPGSGKTSLAYLLFHHQSIKHHFNERVWLHWKYIAGVHSAEEILQIVRQTYLEEKMEMELNAKYLVVIEGFSDKVVEKWFNRLELLLSAFSICKPGTKIIVTSSSESHVLSHLPLAEGAPYKLRPLQEQHDDSLAFFKSIAFRDTPKEDRNNPELNNIALEVFKKCNNILNLIRIIASILSSQPPSKWQYFNQVVLNIPNPAENILSIWNLIVQTPKEFFYLTSLRTLDLQHCKVQVLPDNFRKLRRLMHLHVGDRLIDLPPKFWELTQLQTLDVFIVGNNNGLDALACLTHLAGKLRIRYQDGLEVHVLPEDATFLKGRNLDNLSLEWSDSNAEPAAEKYEKEDDMELELLQPPSTLKILTVKNWKGEKFPKWAMDHFSSLLSNLVFLHVADCRRCKHLPSFSKLGCLKSLELWGLIVLEWIENCDNNNNNSAVAPDETPYFLALEHLSLVNLPRLKGWSRVEELNADDKQEEQRNLPRLHDLKLSGCPEMSSMPHTPNLYSLEISNCHRDLLEQFFGFQPSSAASSSLASAAVPVLQNLCSLKLSDMSTPEPLPKGLEYLTTLQELYLSWLYDLRVLPESIGHLIQLRQLAIRYLPNLLGLPDSVSGLTTLEHVEIRYCPRLIQLPSYFAKLKSSQRLHIKECVKL